MVRALTCCSSLKQLLRLSCGGCTVWSASASGRTKDMRGKVEVNDEGTNVFSFFSFLLY